jgi:hypothetical protein
VFIETEARSASGRRLRRKRGVAAAVADLENVKVRMGVSFLGCFCPGNGPAAMNAGETTGFFGQY